MSNKSEDNNTVPYSLSTHPSLVGITPAMSLNQNRINDEFLAMSSTELKSGILPRDVLNDKPIFIRNTTMTLVDLQDALDASKRAFNSGLVDQLSEISVQTGQDYFCDDNGDIQLTNTDSESEDKVVMISCSTALSDGTVVITVDTHTSISFDSRIEIHVGLSLLNLYIEYNKNLLEMALINETAFAAKTRAADNNVAK